MRTRLARGILILTLLILALAVLLSRTRVPPPPSPSPSPDPYQEARSRMVQTQIVRRGVQDERVLKAMARVLAISSSPPTTSPVPTATIPSPSASARPSRSLTSSPS